MVDRRKVTMTSVALSDNGVLLTHEATDYVALADIDAYVEDAKTRWQSVTVSDEIDYGPAGEDGDYTSPLEIS